MQRPLLSIKDNEFFRESDLSIQNFQDVLCEQPLSLPPSYQLANWYWNFVFLNQHITPKNFTGTNYTNKSSKVIQHPFSIYTNCPNFLQSTLNFQVNNLIILKTLSHHEVFQFSFKTILAKIDPQLTSYEPNSYSFEVCTQVF
jgi:hypothetical protein